MTEEELLQLLANKSRDVSKKMGDPGNFLNRTLAPLNAIGSFPDVAYNIMENPLMAIWAGPKYASNILQGLGSMFLPGIVDIPEFKTTSDVMDKLGVSTGNEWGDMGVGLLGDILTDPTAYLGTGVAKNVGGKLLRKGVV